MPYGVFTDSSVNIFDELNGTGNLLGSVLLAANDPYNHEFAQVNFSCVAQSVSMQSQSNGAFEWDNVTFSGSAIPEPATLALFGLGLAALGIGKRKNT
jgi:hypothetical protein